MPIDLPQVSFNIIPAKQLAGVSQQAVLIVGQKLAGGSATAGVLLSEFPNDGSENDLFGQTSHIAGMVRNFKNINKVSRLDALPLDDAGAAAKAAATMTFVGAATADATIYASIVSEKTLRYEIAVTSGDAIADVATAVAAAFAANNDKEFTIAAALGVVTATAVNGGTLANGWGVKIEGTIPGMTHSVTAFAAGATDPTLTGILDAIGDFRYQTILWPSAYDLTEVQDALDARFNTANAVLDGVAIQVKTDTLSNLKTYADQNSQSIVIMGQKIVSDTSLKGPATLESPDIISAQICAIRALRLTENASLTPYLTTVASKDQFGGIAIASLPYFNTGLPGLPVAPPGSDFSLVDLNELAGKGVSTFGPNRVYNGTIFGEAVTSYLTDNAGNADESYKFLNTVDTASVIREFFFVNMKKRYAQTRLTDGDLIAGRDMANEISIRAFCKSLYASLAREALTQAGQVASKDYEDNLIVEVDVRAGTATINQAPLLVSQLRAILGTIQINFGG